MSLTQALIELYLVGLLLLLAMLLPLLAIHIVIIIPSLLRSVPLRSFNLLYRKVHLCYNLRL